MRSFYLQPHLIGTLTNEKMIADHVKSDTNLTSAKCCTQISLCIKQDNLCGFETSFVIRRACK